mgnify:CR=1 FL=1
MTEDEIFDNANRAKLDDAISSAGFDSAPTFDNAGTDSATLDWASAESTTAQNFSSEKTYANLPLIVIAGRPNVGKSTLFNRLLHKRRAITDPTPGVTRDPIEETAFIAEKPVRIMDTGGFKLERKSGTVEAIMDELVVEKTLQSLKKADRILFLLDASEITGEDEEFIALLRPYWDKVIAAVNKCEGGRLEENAWNYLQFGFKNLLFISAEHGDNIPELSSLLVNGLDFSTVVETETSDDDFSKRPIRISIVGKPNVGKSTLSNRLTHTNASIVSDYSGTTRDVVEGEFEYNGKKFQVLDTAGIRKKTKVKENIEYYSVNRAIKTLDEADIVFHLIDAQEGLAEQDKKIIALAHERGRGIIFVLNKWDTQEQDRKTIKRAEENIRIMFGQMNYAPIVCVSALEGKGIKLLLNTALEVYEQLNKKVETSALNNALKDWVTQYPPPASRSGNFKIRYMVQTSTNPVSFLLFATRPEVVQESYLTFLKNRIRKDLGFDKIPVQLEFKSSRKKWEERGK